MTLDADVLPQQATLDANPPPPVLTALPIMDKTDFLQHAMHSSAQLFFRSGGSSGVPKLAGFTYRDYRRQMQAAAAGMVRRRAGSRPRQSAQFDVRGQSLRGFTQFLHRTGNA